MNNIEILIPLSAFFLLGYIVRTVTLNRTIRFLADKGTTGLDMQELKNLLSSRNHQSAMKWGMVLVAIGTAIFLSAVIPLFRDDQTTFGLLFLFSGGALLLYYFLNPDKEQRA